jgi:hypothetical protein
MKYYSIRVVEADSYDEAVQKVQDNEFDESDPMCDIIAEAEEVDTSKITADLKAKYDSLREEFEQYKKKYIENPWWSIDDLFDDDDDYEINQEEGNV